MRPLLLKMKAFGPYLDEIIDFRKVESKGIFLITGDTGSGKTTIFDAISVALFGESNGDERSAESFKSDFDVQEDIMKIEFSFELKGRIFRVVRIPKQRRKKLRGEGYTEELGEVTLYETINHEEVALDFSRDVNSKIQELLGINSRQFRQIVMIPQGQFRKLITESSEEREKILKSIFNVHKYELFQKRLAQSNKELESTLKEKNNLLRAEISHIRSDEGSNLEQLLQAEDKNYAWIIEETSAQMTQDEQTLNVISENLQAQKKHMILLEGKIEVAKKNNDQVDAFTEATNEKLSLEASKEAFDQIGHRVEMAERAFRIEPMEEYVLLREKEVSSHQKVIEVKRIEIENLQAQLAHQAELYQKLAHTDNLEQLTADKEKLHFLKSIFPKVEGYEGLKMTSQRLSLQYLKEEEQLKTLNKRMVTLQEDHVILTKEKEELAKHPLNIEKTQTLLLDINKLMELILQLEKGCHQYIDALLQHKKSSQAFKVLQQEKELQITHFEEQQKLWLEGQAGILAQGLEEGEACPVCGNSHHVKLAVMSRDMPSKVLLDALKDEQKQLEKRFSNGQVAVVTDDQNALNRKEHLQEVLLKVNEVFGSALVFDRKEILAFCEQKIKELTEETSQMKSELALLKLENKKLEGLMVQLEGVAKKIYECEEEIKVLGSVHLKTLEEKTIKETELSSIEKELPLELRDRLVISRVINELSEGIINIEKVIEEAKTSLEEVQKNLAVVKATLSDAEKGMDERRLAYCEAIESFEKAYGENGFEDKNHFEQMRLTQGEVASLKNQVNAYHQKVQMNLALLLKLSQEVKGLIKIDLSKLLDQKMVIENAIEELTKKIVLIQVRMIQNQEQVNKIEAVSLEINQLSEQQALVGDLSQVANGSSSGTTKITFERYILAAFLEEIVHAANIRFHKMSNSRYELIRKTQGSDKRKHTGLDLEIFDYYTGKARDINTLSGGEGFKASLALALGLADIAQSYAGGISLDTIFVDEGFGSLSSESLDHAINCLMDLKEGGRLVGIISHVQELKDRIDAQLVVEKQKTGSRTYFEGV